MRKQSEPDLYLKAGVLATSIVVAVLLLLSVLVVISMWEIDFVLFTRSNYIKAQKANIESAFTLYCNYPDIVSNIETDSTIQLYDSIPSSKVSIESSSWGLYEVLSVTASQSRLSLSRIVGADKASDKGCNFWYLNKYNSLTIAGDTNLEGSILAPSNGIVYGGMGQMFFNGKKIDPSRIKPSQDKIPPPTPSAEKELEAIFKLRESPDKQQLFSDSISNSFYRNEPIIVDLGSGLITDCCLRGNVVIVGDELQFDVSSTIENAIIVGRKITIGENFKGAAQFFATDTIVVQKGVYLDYPSGLFAKKYIEIGDNSITNGYVIVNSDSEPKIMKPNYKQSRSSIIRGMLYVNGIAQLQGIISGNLFLTQAIFYSDHGYYDNLILDASVLENNSTIYPLWLENPKKRKQAKQVD